VRAAILRCIIGEEINPTRGSALIDRIEKPALGPAKLLAVLLTILLPAAGIAAYPQSTDDSDDEAIQYTKATPNDAITKLQKAIDSGAVKLDFSSRNGYLQPVLRQLKVPAASQILVFSKTSFQRQLIEPDSPRALYYNDNTYIGWVRGAPYLEVSTIDPQLGTVFYILDQRPAAKPKFIRQTYECLQCHTGAMTQGVPGNIMRSVYARADGQPDFRAGSFITTDQSPLEERWGGWYVTGTHGSMRHMGNVIARGADGEPTLDRERGANVIDLRPFVDTTPYINRHSDIVSLMVIEHQAHVQNLITKANYQTRMALRYEEMLNKELKRPANYRAESTTSRVTSACEPLVRAMLFSEEAKLTAPVRGTSGFAGQFEALGIRDKQGRSLRDLDLNTRLMRYPCSYLIYSDDFNGLPALAKQTVYRRLWEVLDGKDKSPAFANLSDADRAAIREILVDTKPDFAAAHPAS
jgi:hypothetical protein